MMRPQVCVVRVAWRVVQWRWSAQVLAGKLAGSSPSARNPGLAGKRTVDVNENLTPPVKVQHSEQQRVQPAQLSL